MTPARLRPCSSAQTRDAMYSTEFGQVFRPIIADLTMRPLRGGATDRHCGIDQEIEPISGLLDLWATLGEYRTGRISGWREFVVPRWLEAPNSAWAATD